MSHLAWAVFARPAIGSGRDTAGLFHEKVERRVCLHACICDKDGRIRKHGDNRPIIALTEESLKDVDADCKDFASNPVDYQKLLEIAERYPRRAAEADADCYATKQ